MFLFAFAENTIQLVPDGTLFLHIALILLMVFVLNALLFKPINSVLERREQGTKGRSRDAQGILMSVDEGLNRYEQSLREARAEGYALMERQRAEVTLQRQARLSEVREEVNRSIEEQKRTIGAQSEGARQTLEQEARRTAIEISERVLHRPVGAA